MQVLNVDEMTGLVGWDIGGVNVKAAWMAPRKDGTRQVRISSKPFEIWRDKHLLPEVLRAALADISPDTPPHAMAVTMSAELSDVFATKSEGVRFVLDCVRDGFPDCDSYALNLSGEFVRLEEAYGSLLDFAASNWVASAQWLAARYPDCILLDVGSTTTDILPILKGEVCVRGRTDMERLSSGELVYTGVLRTNLAAIVQSVPVAGRLCRVSSEYFSVSGDVHLVLGHLDPKEYTCPTPDNRPPTIDSARSRLSRLVCADTDMLSVADIDALALFIYEQQVLQVRSGLEQVVSRNTELRSHPVIVFGTGAFLGREAAGGLGLRIQGLEEDLGRAESAALPCLAVAALLADKKKKET